MILIHTLLPPPVNHLNDLWQSSNALQAYESLDIVLQHSPRAHPRVVKKTPFAFGGVFGATEEEEACQLQNLLIGIHDVPLRTQ